MKIQLNWLTAIALALGASTLAADTAAPTPKVQVAKPSKAMLTRYVDVPGSIQPYAEADLYAKVSGYVSEIKVDIGDRVKSGQVLATLSVPEIDQDLVEAKATITAKEAALKAADAAIAQAELGPPAADINLDRAREVLKLKEITLRRKEELFNEKAATDQDLDEARNAVALAKVDVAAAESKRASAGADLTAARATRATAAAQLEVAKASIGKIETMRQYTKIVAPFDGVITRRMADVGALTQAGPKATALLTVQQIDRLRVIVEVPETEVGRIKNGSKANVRPFGRTDAVEGTVSRTSNSLNPSTRTLRAEIDLPNPETRFLPGMYAVISLAVETREATTVPSAALNIEGKEKSVLVVLDGKAAKKVIQVGLDDAGKIEVTGGLTDDSQVIVTGKTGLSAGAAVQVIP